ncbi:MAG TPA: AAA family ATPase [Candidatus Polarisedimenticolia bacterium]|nr:AAA family ATPase [Candidatus Polarisedimenticolia bacterium]
MAAMLEDGIPEQRFDLAGLLVQRAFTYLTGAPKQFKTFLALAWSICLASGEPFAGRAVSGDHRVLFIEAENWRQIPKRFAQLCAGYDVDHRTALKSIRFFKPNRPLRLENEAHAAELIQIAKGWGATLTVIDSFVRVHGLDENSSKDMALLANVGLLPLRDEAKCGILALDHTPKGHYGKQRTGGEQVRGSGEKLAAADAHLDVDVHRKDGQTVIETKVESFRLAEEPEDSLYLRPHHTPNGGLWFAKRGAPEWLSRGRRPTQRTGAAEIIKAARKINPELSQARAIDLAVAAGYTESTAKRAYNQETAA